MKVIETDDIILPLFSENLTTYVIPVLGNKKKLKSPLKLADGWRFFEDVVILQKNKSKIYKKILNFNEFIELSKSCQNSKNKSEEIYHNLICKRESNINLDFSKCNLMSVLNLTPDSFFNPSRFENLENLRKKIEKLKLQEVDIVDIGAESTRPGAKKITSEEEVRRLKLFFDNIDVGQLNLKLSLDSRNFKTISSFIDNGVLIINDISGFKDKKFLDLLLNNNVSIIIMHMQNNPEKMQENPSYEFPVIDIYEFFKAKIKFLLDNGVKKSQIIIDPGFGFGKNKNHNLNLLNYFPLFHSLGYPICAGLSRKSLIDNIYKDKYKSDISPNERLSGSLSLQNITFLNGAQIIRTHDIFEVQQSFACLEEVYI
jgi:dihydropteroate synthase